MAPIDRRRSGLRVTDDVLRLFVELEATPAGRRKSRAFDARDYELHRMLDLYRERRGSQVSVLDGSKVHPPPRTLEIGRASWERCQSARRELLALARDHGLM
jgi:hypothetical protein